MRVSLAKPGGRERGLRRHHQGPVTVPTARARRRPGPLGRRARGPRSTHREFRRRPGREGRLPGATGPGGGPGREGGGSSAPVRPRRFPASEAAGHDAGPRASRPKGTSGGALGSGRPDSSMVGASGPSAPARRRACGCAPGDPAGSDASFCTSPSSS